MISDKKLDELICEHERYGIMAHRNNDKDALRLINSVVDALQELKERKECELRPAMKFVKISNNSEQVRKIHSEYTEMVTAHEELVAYAKAGMKSTQKFERLHEAFCLEIIDTMAACMTLLHITEKDTKKRAELFRKHNEKDEARGYYDEI